MKIEKWKTFNESFHDVDGTPLQKDIVDYDSMIILYDPSKKTQKSLACVMNLTKKQF